MAELKRTIGLPLLVLYGLGNILGAGIYVLVGEVAGVAGYFAPWSFLLAAGVAAFSAFSYAEMSARYPFAAGEAVYVQEGFGIGVLTLATGLVVALAGLFSAATIIRGLVGYLDDWIPLGDTEIILLLVGMLAAIAIVGVRESVKVAALLTLFEIAGLLLIIAVGVWHPSQPEAFREVLALPPSSAVGGIVLGAFIAFYAFLGYEDMVNIAEEVTSPQTTLPRAILLSLLVSTTLYILVALVAISNIEPARLAASDAPLADLYHSATGQSPWLIIGITGFAVINGALVQLIMGARVFYGMAARGWLPTILAKIWARRQTPVAATSLAATVIAVMAIQWTTLPLARATSYLILLVFLLVNVSLLRIRLRGVESQGVRCYPLWVPILGAGGAATLLIAQWLLA